MQNRILLATMMIVMGLWSTGITSHLGAPNRQGKSGGNSGSEVAGPKARVITGFFYIDHSLILSHPDETILQYGNRLKTRSLNQLQAIWTKGIKNPCVREYEYLAGLSKSLIGSLKLESLMNKTIDIAAKLIGQRLASC